MPPTPPPVDRGTTSTDDRPGGVAPDRTAGTALGQENRATTPWLALGLATGLMWTLARARILVQIESRRVGSDAAISEWRVADNLGVELAIRVLLALGASFLLRGLLRGAHQRWLRVGAALVLAIAAAGLALVGEPWRAAHLRLDALLDLSRKGRQLGIGLALVGGVHWLFALSVARGARWTRAIARPVAILAGLGIVTAVPLYRLAFVRRTPMMTLHRSEREILREPESWKVERAHPDSAPFTGVLSPSIDFTVDGEDQPTLVMAPPCRLSFEAPDALELGLRIAAGIDLATYGVIEPEQPVVFGFAATIDGQRVFEARIEAHSEVEQDERHWVRPASRSLAVPARARVQLETWIESGPADDERAHLVGFGDLLFERDETRERRRSSRETPNLILIVQDTLRSDRLSSYDYAKPISPSLDRLAQRGILFEQSFATSSWTWPSTASILTGLYPERHGVTDDSSCYLAHGNLTVPEVLQERGYTTAAFTCNPLISAAANFHQGFETFDGVRGRFRKTDELMRSVERWLDLRAGVRFFLYLHWVDPHAPYQPRLEDLARLGGIRPANWGGDDAIYDVPGHLWRGAGHDEAGKPIEDFFDSEQLRYWNEQYDASVATGDWFLGRLLDHLEALKIDDETIVVFTSDHGEEWLDHGLLTHGQSVHRELVQVPLVMAGPGIPSGVVVSQPISNRQIAPTLARLGGADLEAVEAPIDLWELESLTPQPVFFSTTHGWWNGRRGRQPIHGLREGRWVLHHAPSGGDWKQPEELAPPDGQLRLYDVESDPFERTDVAERHPERVAAMRRRLDEHLEKQRAQRTATSFGAGSATLRMLGAIGYLGEEEEAADE